MFFVHPFHQVSVAAGLLYVLALVVFFNRAKSAIKREALHSRKRVEYSLIVFITSACTLAYLAKQVSGPAAEAVCANSLSSVLLPEAVVLSSGVIRAAFKIGSTYAALSLARWVRSAMSQHR